ncbi:efflux RND transporter permease subunit [Escherichia coli]
MQNKLQLAMPSLPEAVQQQGISVDKSSSNILMVAAFISDNGQPQPVRYRGLCSV